MAHMDHHHDEMLDRAATALHCKDWFYFCQTGVRATAPSEAAFSFGDFRTRTYGDTVIEALGLSHRRHFLTEIIKGTEVTLPLSEKAATQTWLWAGTPMALDYVDMVMTALGAGVHTGNADAACFTVGSTGVHMRAVIADREHLNVEGTG